MSKAPLSTGAGPPPFTITCSNDQPPGYGQHSTDPQPPGWFHPPAPTMSSPSAPYPPAQPTVVVQPTVHVQPPSTSVVYVQQQPSAGAIIMQRTMALPNLPTHTTCPSCREIITSRVEYKTATKTHLWAACLCVFGCWLGCCLIPYCMNSCKNANHYCSHCGAYIGSSVL